MILEHENQLLRLGKLGTKDVGHILLVVKLFWEMYSAIFITQTDGTPEKD